MAWDIEIKPLAVDEILWAAFLPDVQMGAQMRINRRINGAFQIIPARIAGGSGEFAASDAVDWDPVFDEFDRIRNDFITAHPLVADYVAGLQQDRRTLGSSRSLVRTITALIAADRATEAAQVADDAIARGERGPMSSRVDVLKYLSAYAKGPEAYAAFRVSLIPTHDLQVLSESQRNICVDMSRAHHRGRIGHHLSTMNGSDPWAVVLDARPPAGAPNDHSTSLYLQAAGTAETMVVEFCRPGGADLGAGYVLRPVEGYTADGDRIDLRLP